MKFIPLFLLLSLTGIAFGADPSASPPLRSVFPEPKEIGADWHWEWETPEQFRNAWNKKGPKTEAEWQQQPDLQYLNPKTVVAKVIAELEKPGVEDFAVKFGLAFVSESMEIEYMRKRKEGTQSKEAILAETVQALKARATGIVQVALIEYSRERRNNLPESPVLETPHDKDSLGLEVALYSEDFARTQALQADLSEAAMQARFAVTAKSLDSTCATAEETVTALLQRYEQCRGIAEPSDAIKKELANIPDHIHYRANENLLVQGAMLLGANGGFIIWEENRNPQNRSLTLSGAFRRGQIVIKFTRKATGVFAETAFDDTKRLLNLLSHRLTPYPGAAGVRAELAVDSEHALKKACRPKVDKLPPEIAEKLRQERKP